MIYVTLITHNSEGWKINNKVLILECELWYKTPDGQSDFLHAILHYINLTSNICKALQQTPQKIMTVVNGPACKDIAANF